MAEQPSTRSEVDPYDETAWMAIAIELIAVAAALLFAIYQAH